MRSSKKVVIGMAIALATIGLAMIAIAFFKHMPGASCPGGIMLGTGAYILINIK